MGEPRPPDVDLERPNDDSVGRESERVETRRTVAGPPAGADQLGPVPADPHGAPVGPEGTVEETGTRIVSEQERISVGDDGVVRRDVDRVEQDAASRRRAPTLVPALLVILLLGLGAIAAAWYFTRSDSKSVPSVEGLSVDAAVARLQDDGFEADIAREPNDAPADQVVSQDPDAGIDVDEGSSIALVVSSGPATIAVPNAVGVSEVEARDRLAAAGLRVNVVQVFAEQSEGTVVAQSPEAGDQVEQDATVRLNVSKGSGLVVVPSLVGKPQDDAVAELASAGLDANVVAVPSSEPAGTVVAQNPVGGQAQRGSTVRVNVSKG